MTPTSAVIDHGHRIERVDFTTPTVTGDQLAIIHAQLDELTLPTRRPVFFGRPRRHVTWRKYAVTEHGYAALATHKGWLVDVLRGAARGAR
jgi:hypothetical protein